MERHLDIITESSLCSEPPPPTCNTGCVASEIYQCLEANGAGGHDWEDYEVFTNVICNIEEAPTDDCDCEVYYSGKNCVSSYMDEAGWAGILYVFGFMLTFFCIMVYTSREIYYYLREEYDINISCIKINHNHGEEEENGTKLRTTTMHSDAGEDADRTRSTTMNVAVKKPAFQKKQSARTAPSSQVKGFLNPKQVRDETRLGAM